MLLIDHHEVESERTEDLGRMRGRRLDEGAEQMLAGFQPAAEIGPGRSHCISDHDATG